MSGEAFLELLKSFPLKDGWPRETGVFLLPEAVMIALYNHILENDARDVLELGSGFGATACIMAAAMQAKGTGKVTTVDKHSYEGVNAVALAQHTGVSDCLEVVVEPLGYNWYLADLLAAESTATFDLCLLDGAHEWEPDALAATLVAPLIKPGGWLVLDDLDFKLSSLPYVSTEYADRSPRELETCQMAMVFELVVGRDPRFTDLHTTSDGRVGWARKTGALQAALRSVAS